MPKKWFETAVVLFVILGVALRAQFIYRYAMGLPSWNDWDYLPVWAEFASGGNWLTFIAQPYRETHPMLFPFLIFIGVTWLFGWNLRLLMYLSLAAWVGAAWILMKKMRLTNTLVDLFLVALAALLIFSLRQTENILSGWQLALHVCQLCAVGAFYCLSRPSVSPRLAGGAMGLGVVATFSFGNGLVIWPVGLLQILSRRSLRKDKWLLGTWVSVAGASLGFLSLSSTSSWVASILQNVVRKSEFVLAYLGNPFSNNGSAVYIGGVLVALVAVLGFVAVRSNVLTFESSLSMWIWVGTYGLLSGVLIALGRTYAGTEVALLSRYVSLSIFFSLAAAAIMGTVATQGDLGGRWNKPLRGLCLGGLAIMFFLALRTSVEHGRLVADWSPLWDALEDEFDRDPYAVTEGQMLGILENRPEVLRRGVDAMRSLGVGPFEYRTSRRNVGPEGDSQTLGSVKPDCSAKISVDRISQTPFKYVRMEGWATTVSSTTEVKEVLLACGENILERGLHGLPRPDIAAFFKTAAALKSGWRLMVSNHQLVERPAPCVLRVLCGPNNYVDHPLDDSRLDQFRRPGDPQRK